MEQIVLGGAATSLPERNIALIAVLLHGLRAEAVSALNIEDYVACFSTRVGQWLRIREAKAGSK